MIIYAPILESVPAFTNSGIKIKYKDNIAVSEPNNKHMKIKCLSMTTGNVLFSAYENDDTPRTFPISGQDLDEGQYYKFQIAYSENDSTDDKDLAWSSVAIGRYIGDAPEITLDGIGENSNGYGSASIQYSGTYSHEIEPLYKYKIEIEGVESTGWQLYTEDKDMTLISGKSLQASHGYNVIFSIITVNGYESSTNAWVVVNNIQNTLSDSVLIAEANDDFGYIDVKFYGTLTKSNYILLRSMKDKNNWEKVTTFYVTGDNNITISEGSPQLLYSDLTVEQGSEYYYAIQEFTKGTDGENYTGTMLFTTSPAKANFENMILSDADKTLVIAYNPKASSYKNTILEGKTDTIGSKFPFFFRNGDVKYKEIPISGLISYHMDKDRANPFMNDKDLGLNIQDWNTDLTGANIAAERKFKNAVLNWLNNGQPKILRTPTEGNFIVRIMQVSLSPNDTLGRMLHTFQATAYECADFTQENLRDMNLLNKTNSRVVSEQSIITTKTISSTSIDWETQGENIYNIIWYQQTPNINDKTIRLKEFGQNSSYQEFTCPSGELRTPLGVKYSSVETKGAKGWLTYQQLQSLIFGAFNNNVINEPLLSNINKYSPPTVQSIASGSGWSVSENLIQGMYITGIIQEDNNELPFVLLSYADGSRESIIAVPGEAQYYHGEDFKLNKNGEKLTTIAAGAGAQVDVVYKLKNNQGGNN